MDADDLVVFSPCAVGLDELLKICELYAIEHDITRSVLQLCLQTEILSMYNLVISTYLDAKYHIIMQKLTNILVTLYQLFSVTSLTSVARLNTYMFREM